MRIIFVRHGHPNYKLDCLTELGHRQAAAAAARLSDEKIERIFASTCGRARETAEHIAAKRGLEVEPLEFMREIGWGTLEGESLPFDGHPWYLAVDMAAHGIPLNDSDWAAKEPFCRNAVTERALTVAKRIDALLAEFGYAREGEYYRVTEPCDRTVLIASHGGSGSAALGHMINLPFPYVCGVLRSSFTGVSIVSLEGDRGALISPVIEVLNDARHIKGLEATAEYGK